MVGCDLGRKTAIVEWLIIVLVPFSLINIHFGFIWKMDYVFTGDLFLYYTTWANSLAVLCAIATLYYLRRGERLPRLLAIMKLASVAMLTMSFLIITFMLGPTKGWVLLFHPGGMVFLHIVVPFLAALDFLFLAQMDALERKDLVITLVPVAVYLTALLSMMIITGSDDTSPYEFMKIFSQPIYETLKWIAGFLVSQYIASFVFWVLVGRTNHNLNPLPTSQNC